MLKYINLDNLKVEVATDEEIIVRGSNVVINENTSLSELLFLMERAVKNAFQNIDATKVYSFEINVSSTDGDINEEQFESVVHVGVSAFFNNLINGKLGRPRERRLDVPDNLKENVNCNMSLLKRAINYRTLIDKFQLQIKTGGLIYILVGGLDE